MTHRKRASLALLSLHEPLKLLRSHSAILICTRGDLYGQLVSLTESEGRVVRARERGIGSEG